MTEQYKKFDMKRIHEEEQKRIEKAMFEILKDIKHAEPYRFRNMKERTNDILKSCKTCVNLLDDDECGFTGFSYKEGFYCSEWEARS